MKFHVVRSASSKYGGSKRKKIPDAVVLAAHTRSLKTFPSKAKTIVVEHSLTKGVNRLHEKREATVIFNQKDPDPETQIIIKITRTINDRKVVSTISRLSGTDIRRIITDDEYNAHDLDHFVATWAQLWEPLLPKDPGASDLMLEICVMEPFPITFELPKDLDDVGTSEMELARMEGGHLFDVFDLPVEETGEAEEYPKEADVDDEDYFIEDQDDFEGYRAYRDRRISEGFLPEAAAKEEISTLTPRGKRAMEEEEEEVKNSKKVGDGRVPAKGIGEVDDDEDERVMHTDPMFDRQFLTARNFSLPTAPGGRFTVDVVVVDSRTGAEICRHNVGSFEEVSASVLQKALSVAKTLPGVTAGSGAAAVDQRVHRLHRGENTSGEVRRVNDEMREILVKELAEVAKKLFRQELVKVVAKLVDARFRKCEQMLFRHIMLENAREKKVSRPSGRGSYQNEGRKAPRIFEDAADSYELDDSSDGFVELEDGEESETLKEREGEEEEDEEAAAGKGYLVDRDSLQEMLEEIQKKFSDDLRASKRELSQEMTKMSLQLEKIAAVAGTGRESRRVAASAMGDDGSVSEGRSCSDRTSRSELAWVQRDLRLMG